MIAAGWSWWLHCSLGDWVWCLHCERCFPCGEFRELETDRVLQHHGVDRLLCCAYADCDGTLIDLRPWLDVCEVNPDYPLIPERGKVYRLYGVTE